MSGFKGGGLSAFTAAKIKNTSLPNYLLCSVCHKSKEKTQFSNKQLETARYKIVQSNSYKPRGRRTEEPITIRCRECVGQVNNEMQCVDCGNTKDLNEFAKAQRKTPDHAKCIECMEATLATEPDDHMARIGRYSDDDEDDDDDDDDGRSVTTGISNPWLMDWDGDYVTSTDQNSSRAVSVSGYTGSVAGGPVKRTGAASGLSNLTSANVERLNSRAGTEPSKSYANASSAHPDSELSRAILDMSVKDKDDDAITEMLDDDGDTESQFSVKPGNADAWRTFSAANSHSPPARPQGQQFNAWGPQGQSAVHHRAPSPISASSNVIQRQTPTRQTAGTQRIKPAAARSGNFARVRPDNYKSPEEKAKGKSAGVWASPKLDEDIDKGNGTENGSVW